MMKHNIKYVMALAFMLLMTQGAWADSAVTIIKQLNGAAVTTTSPGDVTYEIADDVCTLTVTPASGYYVTSENITAYSVVTGDVSQAPQRRSPNLDNEPITVTAIGDHSDPSAVTHYTLPMPADGSDVEVTVNFQTAQMYGISIGGVQVSEFNYADVLKDGKVSFNKETNTLTLNGATINGGIVSSLEGGLTVHMEGNNVIDAQESYAFESEITSSYLPLEYTTNETTPGQLLIKNGMFSSGSYQYQSHFSLSFKNGLTLSNNGDKWLIDVAPAMTPGDGLYWTDQQFTVSGKSGDDLYYKYNLNSTEQEYTEPFTLTTGKYSLSALKKIVKDETTFSIVSQGNTIFIHNKPGFSLEAGTHNGTQTITLTNLPTNLSSTAEGYPQVWYYLGENEADSVLITSAEQEIAVSESTKVCVYIIDEDSGKVAKSKVVLAEYTILKEPGYHFSTSESGQSYYSSGSTVYNLNFGQENTLPWLINVPEGLTITYASEDEDVATISETGTITLTGAGHVWLSASNEATEVYQAHTERIRLEIRPTDPQASLVEGAYFTGQKLTLIPTVGNGDIYYSYGDNGEKTLYTENEEIELPKGVYEFYTRTRCVTKADNSETDYMESYGNNHRYYCVYDEPTISHASDTYNGTIEVEITNLPEEGFPVTAYYYFDDDEDNAVAYTAGTKIPVEASKKLNVYLYVEGDSGKKYKTEVLERQYVIRQDAGLAYLQNDEVVEVAQYTIGGDENPALPDLQNENKLTITYTSSNTAVATVNASTGVVTPVGVGETAITATSEQTDVLQAGEASYMLRVYKDLSHESISVTVADVTFTGEKVTPVVTVMDGETDISAFFDFAYSDNVQVGTNAKVTISPKELTDANNYYLGERTESFTIDNRTLAVGTDVTFAEGQTWASLYITTESLNLPEGVMAYIVTGVSATTATLKAINYVPKNVPVFLEKDSEMTTDNTSADGNLLAGTNEVTAVSAINGTVYGLHNNKLIRVTSGSIPAGRAYLAVAAASGAPQLAFDFGNGATGIYVVSTDGVDGEGWYTLDGRKMQQKPAKKGLYIKNGRKVIINK